MSKMLQKEIHEYYKRSIKVMGTRGTFGFRLDGEDKLLYNNCDSYPSGLGAKLIRKLIEFDIITNIEKLKQNIRRLEDICDDEVRFENVIDNLLNGSITGIPMSNNFISDSLFCEWGYIINFDDMVFEVYKGFQTEPSDGCRYSLMKTEKTDLIYSNIEYYPCKCILTIPLDNLPTKNDELDKRISVILKLIE